MLKLQVENEVSILSKMKMMMMMMMMKIQMKHFSSIVRAREQKKRKQSYCIVLVDCLFVSLFFICIRQKLFFPHVTIPPEVWCGVPRPEETGRRFALRLEIDPRASRDDHGCPLTVDLYRSERVIDTVVVYTAKADGESGDRVMYRIPLRVEPRLPVTAAHYQ